MDPNRHKQCYGTMFPSVLAPEADRVISGKVFSMEIVRAGGMFVSERKTAANMQQWDDCLECPEFEYCYRLCMAKIALQSAIAG
jgi:hypothetical protein